MTSEYRPRERHASRDEAHSPNIRVLTIQSPNINNQNILPLIQAESPEYMLVMDEFSFPAKYNDLLVQVNPISGAILNLFK